MSVSRKDPQQNCDPVNSGPVFSSIGMPFKTVCAAWLTLWPPDQVLTHILVRQGTLSKVATVWGFQMRRGANYLTP
jgi:hypothetical protein